MQETWALPPNPDFQLWLLHVMPLVLDSSGALRVCTSPPKLWIFKQPFCLLSDFSLSCPTSESATGTVAGVTALSHVIQQWMLRKITFSCDVISAPWSRARGGGPLNISVLLCVCHDTSSAYLWQWCISRGELFWKELYLALVLPFLRHFRELWGAALLCRADGAQVTIPLGVPLSDVDRT